MAERGFRKWVKRGLMAGALMGPVGAHADEPKAAPSDPAIEQPVPQKAGEEALPSEQPAVEAPPEVDPNLRPDLIGMAENATHNLNMAIDKAQHGNLLAVEGYATVDKYKPIAQKIQEAGDSDLAASVLALVTEVERLSAERLVKDVSEIVEKLPSTIHDLRVGRMNQQQCDQYIEKIKGIMAFAQEHSLFDQWNRGNRVVIELRAAYNELFGPQLPTGLYVDEWNGVHKRAASYGPDDLAGDVGRIAVNVVTGVDRGIDDGLDVATARTGDWIDGMDGAQNLEGIEYPEGYDPDATSYERRSKRISTRQGDRAQRLSSAGSAEEQAALAAEAQLDVLTPPPFLSAADREQALQELQRTGQIMIGDVGIHFVMKGDKVKNIEPLGQPNADLIAEYKGRAAAVLLARGESGNYREIIARTSGLGGRELDALVTEVENLATDLFIWMSFRDVMIEQGLESTPQFEEVQKEVDKRKKIITSRAGHIIWDDPKLGKPSAAQNIGSAIGSGRP